MLTEHELEIVLDGLACVYAVKIQDAMKDPFNALENMNELVAEHKMLAEKLKELA